MNNLNIVSRLRKVSNDERAEVSPYAIAILVILMTILFLTPAAIMFITMK
ncbi:MAG: hypothetical protein M5U10_10860 [Candidatus Methanoperedens sp.]|nr:hypothetical protein [Candidatus Methanoperedens nitroreducens]MDJ1422403.1 hypothetical protein [Candidatus Methanoperedens sp.]